MSEEEKEKAEDVAEKLRNGVYRSVDISGQKGYTSQAWANFLRIYEKEIPKNFAICKSCKQIYSLNGTRGIRNHSCSRLATASVGSRKIDAQFPVASVNLKESKKAFTKACSKFIATDLRPFNTVAGLGFEQLIQAAINIGASKGKVKASDIIPCRTTVTEQTRKAATEVREKVSTLVTLVIC